MIDNSIRTSITEAGWLHKHPNCIEGFPEVWKANHQGGAPQHPMIRALADELHLDEDYSEHGVIIFDAIDWGGIKSIEISTGKTGWQQWLLFYHDQWLGCFEAHPESTDPDDCGIELMNAKYWIEIIGNSGFEVHDKIDTVACFDPKMYLYPELHEWCKQFKDDYTNY